MSGVAGEFTGKRILITGGTQGLGYACALLFAREGARLFLAYRSNHAQAEAAAQALRQAGAAEVQTLSCDLTEAPATELLWGEMHKRLGGCDIYIHNAAATAFKPLLALELHHVDKTLQLTVKSFIQALKHAAAIMPSGGTIVTVSGMDTLRAVPFHGLLAAAKSALETLTTYAAHELAEQGIRVNGVNPGFFDTASTRKYLGPLAQPAHKQIARQSPEERLPELSEIAETIAFLASPRSSWIRGQTLIVDGGATHSIQGMLPDIGG
jgi:enoyl-[acyl-carrier protein] reductase III